MKMLAILLLSLLALVPSAQEEYETPAPVHFATYALVLDSGDAPLAAWQVEVTDPTGRTKVVGIEGGDHAAYREPARYDPQALTGGRIVLAAFSLDEDLPTGATRVATLHLEVQGTAPVDLTCIVQAAADPAGDALAPTSHLRADQ